MESAQAGEREVEQLSQALSDTRSEFKALQMRNTELLRAHNELALQIRKRVRIPVLFACCNVHVVSKCNATFR